MGARSGFVVMNQTADARAARMDDVARIEARSRLRTARPRAAMLCITAA